MISKERRPPGYYLFCARWKRLQLFLEKVRFYGSLLTTIPWLFFFVPIFSTYSNFLVVFVFVFWYHFFILMVLSWLKFPDCLFFILFVRTTVLLNNFEFHTSFLLQINLTFYPKITVKLRNAKPLLAKSWKTVLAESAPRKLLAVTWRVDLNVKC